MKRIAMLALVAAGAFALAGCGGGGGQEQAAEKAPEQTEMTQKTTAARAVDAAKTVAEGESITCEVGCAGCVYHMEGINHCAPAVKMAGGEPMLLQGIEVDAHGLGLCEGAREATVMGKVQDGVFIASAVELQQE